MNSMTTMHTDCKQFEIKHSLALDMAMACVVHTR